MPTKKSTTTVATNLSSMQQNNQNNLPLLLSILALIGTVYTLSKVQTLEKTLGGKAPTAQVGNPQALPEPTPDLSKMPGLSAQDHVRGSLTAQVVAVEYSDYECPFCQRFHPTMEKLKAEYGDKMGWVFRHYPLSFHPFAQKSAEAAECVAKFGGNDKFWSFTDLAFKKASADRNNLSNENLLKMVAEVGVDSLKVKTCLESGEMAAKVKADMDGGSAAGVTGTPGTILIGKNGKRDFIEGAFPYEQVKAKVEALLK